MNMDVIQLEGCGITVFFSAVKFADILSSSLDVSHQMCLNIPETITPDLSDTLKSLFYQLLGAFFGGG